VQALGERHHRPGVVVAQQFGLEVTQADAVETVGVLQRRHQGEVRVPRRRPTIAVDGHRRFDGRVISLNDTPALAEFLRLGQPSERAPSVGAMMLAPSVMLASDIVQVDCRPQPLGLLHSAGGRDESQSVDENPRDVRLAVKEAPVTEQLWRHTPPLPRTVRLRA
jgi:hypothetical protein